MITKQTFLDAADLIEKEGLERKLFINQKDGCGLCTVGAIAVASGLKKEKQGHSWTIVDICDWLDSNLTAEPISLDFLRFAGIMPKNSDGTEREVYHASNYMYDWSDASTQYGVVAVMRAFGNSPDES